MVKRVLIDIISKKVNFVSKVADKQHQYFIVNSLKPVIITLEIDRHLKRQITNIFAHLKSNPNRCLKIKSNRYRDLKIKSNINRNFAKKSILNGNHYFF